MILQTPDPSPRLSLDVNSVKTLVSPSGGELVKALHRKRYQRTLLGIRQIYERISADSQKILNSTGFDTAFEMVRSCPAAVQARVLSYPSIAFWVDVAEDLLQRESHVRFPEMHVTTHLEGFSRAALAVSILTSSAEFSCYTRTDAAARLCLPGTSVIFQLPTACSYQRVKVSVSSEIVRTFYEEGGQLVPIEASRVSVPLIDNVELNGFDYDLRLPGRTTFQYEDLDEAGFIRWQSPIQQSLRWIAASCPELSREMDYALRCITPIRSLGPDTHLSATFREAPGLMALSWTPDTAIMMEAMVHEYHHNKLNTLLVLDPLITGPTDKAIFYSPWRTDPRPLLGILHGAFVFHAVLEFWCRFFQAEIPLLREERVRQRMYLILGQIRQALNTLSSEAEFSSFGSALVEGIESSVERLSQMLPKTTSAVQRHIEAVQREHRATWQSTDASVVASRELTANADSLGQQPVHPFVTEALRVIGRSSELDLAGLCTALPVTDVLLEKLVVVQRQRGLSELNGLIPEGEEPIPPWANLIAGHVLYLMERFDHSAVFYARLLQQIPKSLYFWQCFAFAVRHVGYLSEGMEILTNLGRIASRSEPSDDVRSPLSERLSQVKRALANDAFCAK
jgi:HEXXH motif-containing protein